MKYRIHFVPKGSYWCVQTSNLGLFWDTAMKRVADEGPTTKLEVHEFATLDDAQTYVRSIGLDSAYDRTCYHKDKEAYLGEVVFPKPTRPAPPMPTRSYGMAAMSGTGDSLR